MNFKKIIATAAAAAMALTMTATAFASYTAPEDNNGVYEWNLVDPSITADGNNYVDLGGGLLMGRPEQDGQGRGVGWNKAAWSGDNYNRSIQYTPAENGTLTATLAFGTLVLQTGSNYTGKGTNVEWTSHEGNVYTAKLSAGTTYYILGVDSWITFQTITYTPDPVSAEVTNIESRQFPTAETNAADDDDLTAAKVEVSVTGSVNKLGLTYNGDTKYVNTEVTNSTVVLGAIVPGLQDLTTASFTAVVD